MRNYNGMTHAELIEIIKSLERVQPPPTSELKTPDQASPSNTIACAGRPAPLMTGDNVCSQCQTETDLRRAQEWMSWGQRYAKFGIWEWDIKSGITYLSKQIVSLFGYENETLETTREDFLSAVHQDDRQRVIDTIHSGVDYKGRCIYCNEGFDIQYRIVKPDGTVRWMHERGGVERSEDGHPWRILGVVQDITDQKHAEQVLRESEEHFRFFAENIHKMIWIASPSLDKLFYVNHVCSEVLGIERHDLCNELSRWREIVYPEDLPLVEAALLKQEQGVAAEVEARIVRADEKFRWIRIRSFPVKNGQGERMSSGIVEDITDRRQLENERLANMAQQRTNLVREVHHRIKNNLQGVVGLLRQQANQYPEVSEIIAQAIAQVRTVAVVHGLQGQAFDNEVVLCEMVPTIARTVETLLSSRVVLDVCVDVPQRIRINEQESVPIALILNELIMNAAKHAAIRSEAPCISITVSWDQFQTQAMISIVNPGMLPEGFDFFAAKGTGTGLELVRSLLPPKGSNLLFISDNGEVKAALALCAPSIYNF